MESTEYESREKKKIPLYEMENVLPFLEGANKRTLVAFHHLLNDPDIPSEGKREEMVSHTIFNKIIKNAEFSYKKPQSFGFFSNISFVSKNKSLKCNSVPFWSAFSLNHFWSFVS